MSTLLRPIYLFADGQFLFWEENDELFLESVRLQVKQGGPTAAYIGASNGDAPDFYSIFERAMSSVAIEDCRMLHTMDPSLSILDRTFLDRADIIFLADGDVEQGWKAFKRVGLDEILVRRYREGAVLIGAGAGAMQLGLYGCSQKTESFTEIFDTLKLVPFLMATQGERNQWARLRQTVGLLDIDVKAIGLPIGGGAIYHPDGTLEPVRHALQEYSIVHGEIKSTLLLPSMV